jgi:carbonic anhydrase
MLKDLIANNRAWASGNVSKDPAFFQRLVDQQTPEYLWIGCSDSRVPANEIVGLAPGEIFVHRNVANLAPPKDLNYRSVLQFAVEVLKVKHILVVGHYGCGGVRASVDGQKHGLVDKWIKPIGKLYAANRQELKAIKDEKARMERLVELNVLSQVRNVATDPFVTAAWARGQEVAVHGWVYSLATGLIKELITNITGPEALLRLD